MQRWSRSTLGLVSQPLWRDSNPVFVLSTGRTGTDALHRLLDQHPKLAATHEPKPQLMGERKDAHQRIDAAPDEFLDVFVRARGAALLGARLSGRRYVETSARLTFFAPVIASLLPHAKFIYMFRHPAAVVTSGMRRRWYVDHEADAYRIVPRLDDPVATRWPMLTPFEKICWYWQAYNRFSLEAASSLATHRVCFLRAESFFERDPDTLRGLFEFLGISPLSDSKIDSVLVHRHNAQVGGHAFPDFDQWTPDMRRTLQESCGAVMSELGYAAAWPC